MRTTRAVRPQKRQNNNLEDQHQKALCDWAKVARLPDADHIEPGSVVADYLYHIPNGGSRNKIEAGKLKGMGAKAGVSDLHLPLPMHGRPGLWIEMKKPYRDSKDKNYPTKEQRTWLNRMRRAGYLTAVCYSWFEARQIIQHYIGGQHDEIR